MKSNLKEIVQRYISDIENRKDISELVQFYHPEIEQIEFPNILLKNKTIRKLNDIKEAYVKGKAVLQNEKYRIMNSFISENTVVIEVEWIGVLSIPIGNKQIGDEIKAHFAQFFEFESGLIKKQRNYDCFEQF